MFTEQQAARRDLMCQEIFEHFTRQDLDHIERRVKAMAHIDDQIYGWTKRFKLKFDRMVPGPSSARFRHKAYLFQLQITWARLEQLTKKPFSKSAWTKPILSNEEAEEFLALVYELRETFEYFRQLQLPDL